MTDRYGYGYGEDDLPASRRGPGVTGQRGDEAEPPQRADVREIDLTEDDLDGDERDEAAERIERLREAAREEEDDEPAEAHPPFQLGSPAGAYREGIDEDEVEAVAADEASPPAGAATVDISAPPDEGDQAAVVVVDGGEEAPATERPGGITLAQATPPPRSETAEDSDADEAALPPAEATPALRSGALLAMDGETIRRQFIDIQAGFVDEPRQAVEQAGELVEELHRKVLESLKAERGQLSDALDADAASTEDLRQALRAYRAYVDRLLGLSL